MHLPVNSWNILCVRRLGYFGVTIPTVDFDTSKVGWAGAVLTGELARDVLMDGEEIIQVMNSYLRTRGGADLEIGLVCW